MTFVHQHVWGWQIATYLFLGGLGGATFAISAILHLFEGCDRKMLSVAVLSSIGFLVLGTVFLLADMLQPLKPESRIKRTLLGGHSQIFQEQPISGY